MKSSAGCAAYILVLALGWSVFGPSAAHAQAPARLENRPGIVAFKRYAWSGPDDLMATEFVSYVDRRAEVQRDRGYIQFRLVRNQIRQVQSDALVELVHYDELKAPETLVAPSDLVLLNSLIDKADRISGYSEVVASLVAPYLLALKNEREQFQSGRLKVKGVWRSRSEYLADSVSAILADARAGGISSRKDLEARIKTLQSEGHSTLEFQRQIANLRESWFGLQLDAVEAALKSGPVRKAGDLLETFRMDVGSTTLGAELRKRVESLTALASEAVLNDRRQELLSQLRDAGIAPNRKSVVLRELEKLGVTEEADVALVRAMEERLNLSQNANRTVAVLVAQSGSLLDAAARRRVESGSIFQAGDNAPAQLAAQVADAWKNLPSSESDARARLADLQTLIETAGQLNFHLNGNDWKAVPELASRLRDTAQRTGAGLALAEGIDAALQKRRDEVSEVIATAKKAEAEGRRSDAFQLYLKAQEMLPDDRAAKEIRRLSQQALGL